MPNIQTLVPALDKIVRICDYLDGNKGATFSQIFQDLNLPKSSTSTLLNALVMHGILRQDQNKFYLGLKLHEWGDKSLEQFDITKIAEPLMTKLRDQTNLTCHLGVLDGLYSVYIAKIENDQAIGIRTWIGKKLPLHSSGIGKALIAWLPDEKIDQLIPEDKLPKYTDTTITSKKQLKKELAKIRSQGWAYDNQEDVKGVHCIAAPIFNKNHEPIAAISISGVLFQLPVEKIEKYSELVRKACQQLTNKF
ncbi:MULTISPECIES: IclR family transcriptional regulator [unclassified Gilliamella]|uniref:IclR family transcriptional regulator n=1 Tax=unclassified Gilliamella TaxID=2685620 RepID=UPI0008107061|nr:MULTISPECIES: IclR family transcriptional regulator [Gilliamella]MCX8584253.1 IclR family transcriptional regulator [Gilliamella sp. B3372]MCX8595325.1 IclR family transcriptional regulator [Gilliamella sp. B3367]MCX8663268.1 IclR family transcriptional regulator [Gilliamella sp. B2911]OCL17146.1 IclR family transcriptional regulator [Gilliamella apicola]